MGAQTPLSFVKGRCGNEYRHRHIGAHINMPIYKYIYDGLLAVFFLQIYSQVFDMLPEATVEGKSPGSGAEFGTMRVENKLFNRELHRHICVC